MRAIRYALLVAALGVTQPGFAADLPIKAPPAPPPVFSWTGCYIGPQIGYAWVRDRNTETADGAVAEFNPIDAAEPRGFKAGGMLGCNWQIPGTGWVIGIEGDGEGADINHGFATYANTFPADNYETRIDWQASVRGRLGYAFDGTFLGWTFNRTLVYATGGAAWANVQQIYFCNGCGLERISSTRDGWTVGGGLEYAFLDRWTIRGEYRYSDFGTHTDFPVVTFVGFAQEHETTEHAVRFGVTYKFWPW